MCGPGEAPPISRQGSGVGCMLECLSYDEPLSIVQVQIDHHFGRVAAATSDRCFVARSAVAAAAIERCFARRPAAGFQAALEQMSLPPVRQYPSLWGEPIPLTRGEALRRWWRLQWRALRSLVVKVFSLELNGYETVTKSWHGRNNDEEVRTRQWRLTFPYGMVIVPFLVVIATRAVPTRFRI